MAALNVDTVTPILPLASRGFNALTQALLDVNPDFNDSGRGVRQGNLSVGNPTHETAVQTLTR